MNNPTSQVETIFANLQALRRELTPRNLCGHKSQSISFAQAGVLFALQAKRAMNNTEIADHLSISPSAATQLVDALEERRFIRRETGDQDRRVSHIRLTAHGSRYLVSLRKSRLAQLQQIFSVLDQRELDQLVRITAKLAAAARKKDIA